VSKVAAVVAAGHLPGSRGPDTYAVDCPFWWINDHTGLIVRPSHRVTWPDDGYIVDTRSLRYTHAGMTSLFRYTIPGFATKTLSGKPTGQIVYNIGGFQASPDAIWGIVCGFDFRSADPRPKWTVGAFELAHPGSIHWAEAHVGETFQWLTGSRSWLGLYSDYRGLVHLRTYTNGLSRITVTETLLPPSIGGEYLPGLEGASSGGSATAVGEEPNSNPLRLRIYGIRLAAPDHQPSVEQTDVPAPLVGADERVLEHRLSPDGTKMAWLISYTHYPFNLRKLAGLAARIGIVPYRVQSICVSNVDGSAAHPIGEIRAQLGRVVDDLDWLPGGKSISFLYMHAIYTIPIGGSAGSDD